MRLITSTRKIWCFFCVITNQCVYLETKETYGYFLFHRLRSSVKMIHNNSRHSTDNCKVTIMLRKPPSVVAVHLVKRPPATPSLMSYHFMTFHFITCRRSGRHSSVLCVKWSVLIRRSSGVIIWFIAARSPTPVVSAPTAASARRTCATMSTGSTARC